MAVTASTKAEPVLTKTHVSHLVDPRSPTNGVDRTPIQVFIYIFSPRCKL